MVIFFLKLIQSICTSEIHFFPAGQSDSKAWEGSEFALDWKLCKSFCWYMPKSRPNGCTCIGKYLGTTGRPCLETKFTTARTGRRIFPLGIWVETCQALVVLPDFTLLLPHDLFRWKLTLRERSALNEILGVFVLFLFGFWGKSALGDLQSSWHETCVNLFEAPNNLEPLFPYKTCAE